VGAVGGHLALALVGGHLALALVGEMGQGRGQVERGLGQGDAEQETHGTQAQRQHGQRGPGRAEWADVTVPVPLEVRYGPPLSPASPAPAGRMWWHEP
jgi:hypothetical protein